MIKIDFNKITGIIKPVNAGGQPPILGTNFGMFRYLTDASVPYSRLHDVGGAYGGGRWVDIPNIFRNFDADENDPDSYDFAFTDLLITALMEAGIEPYFRLGVTIENACKVKYYRIDPPKDFHKWARICEHIIRHYTEGWADGFEYSITYWEIWNEPDNFENPYDNMMWKGTEEEYFRLYDITSKHLKKCFPDIKVGGYSSSGFYEIKAPGTFIDHANSTPRTVYLVEYFERFLNYIKESGAPMDFFSWHSYDDADSNTVYANYVRSMLDKAGYTETESHCTEWNGETQNHGTYRHAAVTASILLEFQRTPVDLACFYDMRCGMGKYAGLFCPATYKPLPPYYAFLAFGELYRLGNEVALDYTPAKGVYAVAARNEKYGTLMMANVSKEAYPIELSAEGAEFFECRVTVEGECDRKCSLPKALAPDSILTVRYIIEENI